MFAEHDRTRLALWLNMCRSAGWWHPHKGVVFLCERPSRQAVDAHGRLHCATGPAIECRDGWRVYAWHNVRVTEQIIEQPDTLTVEQIVTEPNAEVRRVMVERVGLDRFLTMAQAKVLHTDHGGQRVLHRIDWQNDEPIVAVQVTCPSTGQIYFLRVPPQIDRCDKAVAWTFSQDVKEYAPSVET